MDDAFVHFDKHRKERMLNYLRELSQNYQVLYFTCTKDNIIPSKEMIILNKLEEGGKMRNVENLNPGDSVDHFS